MVTNRITVAIQPEMTKRLRAFQGELANSTEKSWSFSATVVRLAEQGLKEQQLIIKEELEKKKKEKKNGT